MQECSEKPLLSHADSSLWRSHTRVVGALAAAPCWAMIAIATLLTPSPDGYGTHEQLGLPACSLMAHTGWPCPSCGMTTAVAFMAHGRWGAAFHAQPFGAVLFLGVIVLAVAGTRQLITGMSMPTILRPRLWWLPAGLAGMLLGWAWIIMDGIHTGRLPVR